MNRFLFVVTGHTTHVGAHVSVATELLERGHEVAWAGPETHEPLPPDVRFYPVDDDHARRVRDAWLEDPTTGSFHDWLSDIRWLYDRYLIPLAVTTLPAVEHAVDEFDATVVVADEHAFAGAFAARRGDRRFATLVRSAALAARSDPVSVAGDQQMACLEAGRGAAAGRPCAGRKAEPSPHLVIGFSTPELHGTHLEFPPEYRFVGPALEHRLDSPADETFPWDELQEGRRLLVSLGTVIGHKAGFFFERIRAALAGGDAQVILVAPPDAFPDPPPNVVVRPSVPQIALLSHVDAVVSHGGYNTVLETLGHGLPLVVAPFTFDQPIVAEQVVRSGAGIRVRPSRVRPKQLAQAIASVLEDPQYRQAAERLRDSFAAAGGTAAAASALEDLAG